MWVQLVIMIIALILSEALKPKPQVPNAATLNDVSIPTIEQGTPVGVVFGDVWVDSWAVLWYGDLKADPIKSGGKK